MSPLDPRKALILRAAALYNLGWGALVIALPTATLGWLFPAESEVSLDPLHVTLWQCIGMIVGVYGVGYWCAARDPLRHWPIVLVGLMGKVFGPIGFLAGALRGEVPWTFGRTIVTNDLIWWVPFAWILWEARRRALENTRAE